MLAWPTPGSRSRTSTRSCTASTIGLTARSTGSIPSQPSSTATCCPATRSQSRVRRALPELPPERIRHVDHHLAHAASAYFTSGWDECLVVVIDGMGEAHGATVYRAKHGLLEPAHRISASDSIGIFYSLVTLHLGFDFNADEYKMMGLAPYGNPERFRAFFDQAVTLNENGGWDIPLLKLQEPRAERERYAAAPCSAGRAAARGARARRRDHRRARGRRGRAPGLPGPGDPSSLRTLRQAAQTAPPGPRGGCSAEYDGQRKTHRVRRLRSDLCSAGGRR